MTQYDPNTDPTRVRPGEPTYRETTTKILNEFRAQGLIDLKRGRVVLLDALGLRALAEQAAE